MSGRTILAVLASGLITLPVQAADNPWLGKWQLRLADPKEPPETLIYSDAGDGAMRMEAIEMGSVIVTRFDGRPASDLGAPIGQPRSLAVQWQSPNSYLWTFRMGDVPVMQGLNTVSENRTSFTEIAWKVSDPGRTFVLIYDRVPTAR